MSTTVNDTTPAQGNTYADIAAGLRLVAEALDTLASRDDLHELTVGLNIQPIGDRSDDITIHTIDALANALFGRPGVPTPMSGGTWHYHAEGQLADRFRVATFGGMKSPDERAKDAELAELRARVAEAPALAEPVDDNPDDQVLQDAADHLRDDLTDREAAAVARAAEPDDAVRAEPSHDARLPLSRLTLEAVQGAAIRADMLSPGQDEPTMATLAQHLGRVAEHSGVLVDARAADPLVGALLDLAAHALRWVEQIEGGEGW